MQETAIKYEQKAIHRFVAVSKRMNEVSHDEDFELSDTSDNKLPLILHHATTGLTAMALVKSVEHAITSASPRGEPSQSTEILSSELRISLSPILLCLSTLTQSVSGECMARPALQDLLRRYGDILLDCWNQDMA